MTAPSPDLLSEESRRALLSLGARWVDEAIDNDAFLPPLVEGLLEQNSKAMLYGPSASGKSSMAIDLACHIALGRRWHDRYVQRGGVVYVAAEAPMSVIRRVLAFRLHHRIDVRLPMLMAPPQALGDSLNELADRALFEGSVPPGLVIIDTLAAAFPGEEDAQHFTSLAADLDRIRQAFCCAVLLVHHSGKQERSGARGHSSLFAAMDTVIHVGRRGDRVTATVEKQRDGMIGGRFSGLHKPVTIGTRSIDPAAAKQIVTACVVVPTSTPEVSLHGFRPTEPAALLLEALRAERDRGACSRWRRADLYQMLRNALVATTKNAIGPNTPRRAVDRLLSVGVLEKGADGFFALSDAQGTAHSPHIHSQSERVSDESQTHSHPTPL